jgi:4a-hydroxytetrahydrobiopterin dehydratase
MKSLPHFADFSCSERKAKDLLIASTVERYLAGVPDWQLTSNGKKLRRRWVVKDFLSALDFFRRLGRVAQAEDHHPDLHVREYRNVTVELWTHSAGGLTMNDFIMAAKIDRMPIELKAEKAKA